MGLPAKKRKSGCLLVLGWAVIAVLVAFTLLIAKHPRQPLDTSAMGLGLVPEPVGPESPTSLPARRGPCGELPPWARASRATIRGGNQPPAPRESPDAEQLDASALRAAADFAEQQGSCALVVTRHGYIVFEQYWRGSNLDTMVHSIGLGRVLTALTTGAAISARKIGWPDEPVGYLIPAWKEDPRGEITVRNLLQMSSGLGLPPTNSSAGGYFELPLKATPGKRWLDQTPDPDLLAYVIQTATGQPYAEYVSQEIWSRIGAADASISLDEKSGRPHVDVGFQARLGDWLRVAELLLRNGNYQGDEVLVPRWVPELLQPAQANPHYGSYVRLGARTEPGAVPYATDDVFVVEGDGNVLWLVPSLQLAILRIGDTLLAPSDESSIPNMIIRGARDYVPPPVRPGADLRQLVPNH